MVKIGSMHRDNDYKNKDKLIEYLGNELSLGRLALVLGAGVSAEMKLPNWDKLISTMFENALDTKYVLTSDPKQNASRFVARNLGDSEVDLPRRVQDALYADYSLDLKELMTNDLLSSLGALVISSRRGNVAEVITLNYDNLLELYLEYHGLIVNSVSEVPPWSQNTDVTIYHPHGYLPLGGNPSKEIVLTSESYYRRMQETTGSSWKSICLSIMQRKICIFLGLSGRDDNLNSLMIYPKDDHPTYREQTPYFGVTFSTSPDRVHDWKQKGVFCCIIDDYGELPRFLLDICRAAAKQ